MRGWRRQSGPQGWPRGKKGHGGRGALLTGGPPPFLTSMRPFPGRGGALLQSSPAGVLCRSPCFLFVTLYLFLCVYLVFPPPPSTGMQVLWGGQGAVTVPKPPALSLRLECSANLY